MTTIYRVTNPNAIAPLRGLRYRCLDTQALLPYRVAEGSNGTYFHVPKGEVGRFEQTAQSLNCDYLEILPI